MEIKDIAQKVLDSSAFDSWNNKDNYLVSCFFMNSVWSVDFYSKKTKKVTSFLVEDEVKLSDEDKVFQREENDLEELKLDEVKVSLDSVLDIISSIKEKESGSEVQQKIVILQKIKFPLWNVTLILKDFNLFNIKVNATNGEVIEKELAPVFNFRTK